jgi:hypothetical protein
MMDPNTDVEIDDTDRTTDHGCGGVEAGGVGTGARPPTRRRRPARGAAARGPRGRRGGLDDPPMATLDGWPAAV